VNLESLPKEAEDTFWLSFGAKLPPGAKVFVSKTAESPRTFLDARGALLSCIPSAMLAHLIFVDLYPEANWAHDCLYVFAVSGGNLFAVAHNWPPLGADDFLPMEKKG
jgi:hypothetical protein